MNPQESQPHQHPPLHSAQPMVVVVNQPVDARQMFYMRHPYLRRGALFSNGCRCYNPHIILLCTAGISLLVMGAINLTIGNFTTGISILALGGTLLGLGLYIVRTAFTQFNDLPPDHPDRAKYTFPSITITSGQNQGPATYTMPPMQQQVMSYPSPAGGQMQAYTPPTQPPPTNNTAASSGFYGSHFQPAVGTAPGYVLSPVQGPYAPDNDPPPAYSDVVKNA